YSIWRPVDPDDVFNVSKMMIDYLDRQEEASIRGKEPEKRTTKVEIPRGRRVEIRPAGAVAGDSILPDTLSLPLLPDSVMPVDTISALMPDTVPSI
ncbi:MAG: hypothetical protein K2F62_03195, partial [Muribaculaceae bacterium]|nr:hypothetical protein [Muribaculaceae bacterium]